MGRRGEYGTIDEIATLAKINQQVYNRLAALFYADHDVEPAESLRLTRTELAVRHDVDGYDASAWVLYEALGDRVRARDDLHRALAISPNFGPIQAPRARAALAEIA